MAPFPDDVENVDDFRFYERTDDDRFGHAGIRFFIGADTAGQQGDTKIGHDSLDHEVTLACFKDDFWLEADFLAFLDNFIVEVEVIPIEDKRFVGKLAQGDGLFLRQDVIAMDDDVHRILGEKERFEILFLRLRADDAQIDESFLYADFNFFRAVFIEIELDLRVFLLKGT